jgi:glycosyltransferase involved in cell wall biosynthesis
MTPPDGPTTTGAANAPGPGVPSGQRISVALCTYNGARFLDAQLESYRQQTRVPDELVVCDDGSADDTLAIVERFAGRAPFPVRIVRNQATLGSTKNFEKAIGLCTGELIATSDQDDVWLPEKLALGQAVFAARPDCGLVFSNADVVDDELRPLGHHLWDAIHFGALARRRFRRGRAFDVLLRQWVVTGATMMFRAEHRPHILPIPETWIHDGWIAFIIGALAPVAFVDRTTMQYRQHAAQQIGSKKLGWRELYEKAREVGRSHFRREYERFCLAHERLCALAPLVRAPACLARVARKVRHQQRRLAIAECPSRLRRVLLTLDELVRWGYQRYSPTTSHFLKDLLF